MKDILLQGTLGHSQIDSVVQEVIQVYEDTFPGQIAAYYVEGSYADQTSLTTSDIDLVIVFRNQFADADARSMAERTWTCKQVGAPEVDITVVDEESLRGGVSPTVKLGGRLIYGQDVCGLYPLLPIEAWARERMHAAYWLLINVYQRPTPVHLPLTFPSPSDEFYGYTNRTIRLPDGQEVLCTRNLVRTTGWAATQRHSWLSKLGNMQGENAIVRGCIAIILVTNGHYCLKRLLSPAETSGSISFQLRPMRESSCVRCANVPFVLNSIF
jgi:hypothetical protein